MPDAAMTSSVASIALMGIVAAVGSLLCLAGIMAGFILKKRSASAPSWFLALTAFAAGSPWKNRDLWCMAGVLILAQFLRRFGPHSHSIWLDAAAFQGAILGALAWRMIGKTRPLGIWTSPRTFLYEAILRWLAILPFLWLLGFAWNWLWSGLLSQLGFEPSFQHAVQLFLNADSPWARVQFLFFAVLVAPIAEEILFRGVLLPLLIRHAGPFAGVAVVSIGFALLHGIESFPVLVVFSVVLSMAYARTKCLLVPILMHSIFNAVNLALIMALLRIGVLTP